jgi:dTDP-4-amino-4,6-dideoxygalactose transaminase
MGAAAVTALEARIAALSGRSECVLVGHANTGIFLALRLLFERLGSGEVIVPAITCSSVAQVVAYAGFDPVFADVELPDCTAGVASFEAAFSARTRAIVPIHIFGNPAPVDALEHWARERGVTMIEDAAQATGGALAGRPFGSFGDFSVHSFGGTKILAAGAGGALVTDDANAARRARELLEALPPLVRSVREALLSLSHRNLTHGLTDLLRVDPDAPVAAAFRNAMPFYRELYLHRLPLDSTVHERIAAGLDELADNLGRRRELAARYEAGLATAGAALRLSDGWRRSGVVWRYSLLVSEPELLLAVTRALRTAGLDASNHYWSVAQLMDDRRLSGAEAASRRLLNLWVDGGTSTDRVDRAVAVIHEVVTRPVKVSP